MSSIDSRFWSKISVEPDGCWQWLGVRSGNGYGQLYSGDRGIGMIPAHRASWEIHFGRIPGGLVVCHRCDDPMCVNPAHLFLGTVSDNAFDAKTKGRSHRPRGEKNGQAKLTAEKVRVIKQRLGTISQEKLAREYGVSQSAISFICLGKRWSHVA